MLHHVIPLKSFTPGPTFAPVLRRSLRAWLLVCLLLACAGCHSLIFEWPGSSPAPANDPPAGGLKKPAAASQLGTVAATTTDRAVLGRSQWIQAVPPSEGDKAASPYHWRHPGLEDLLSRPVSRRVDLRPLLADKDPIVSANAAIALARLGDPSGAERLAAAADARAAALSALCGRRGPGLSAGGRIAQIAAGIGRSIWPRQTRRLGPLPP